MPKPTLYHNPRCSKSRQALAYVQEKDIEFEIREYLKQPLDESELRTLIDALGVSSVIELIRTKEKEFAQANLSKTSDNETLIKALVSYPKLLERPIFMDGNLAAIGRPLENIKALFGE